ncbi:MAG: transketolase [Ruminiclostridium sp.]
MSLSLKRINELQELCQDFRKELLDILYPIQTGHPGGSLSCTEILTVLFFEKMNIDPLNLKMEGRDRFILSKGHAAPMLYINMAHRGYFCTDDLCSLRQMGSHLQGHPCLSKTPGIELSTGSLGLGLSAGIGMALSDRLNSIDSYTYVLLGDGEIQEGIIWEAAMSGYKFKTDNLIAILDNNGVQLDGTLQEIMPMGDIKSKWSSFGWKVITVNGHNIAAISDAIDEAKLHKGSPTIIIAQTIKGKGVSFMEGKNQWHGKPISQKEYQMAKEELDA